MSGYRDGMSDAAVILDAMKGGATLTRGTRHPSKPAPVPYLRHAGGDARRRARRPEGDRYARRPDRPRAQHRDGGRV